LGHSDTLASRSYYLLPTQFGFFVYDYIVLCFLQSVSTYQMLCAFLLTTLYKQTLFFISLASRKTEESDQILGYKKKVISQ